MLYDLKPMLDRIKKEKKNKGYKNTDLALKTDISVSTLSKVLAGIIKEPPVTTIIKIAIALNVSADYLIFGEDTSNTKNSVLEKYNKLNSLGKEKTDIYISDLLDNPKYVADDDQFDTGYANVAADTGKNKRVKAPGIDTIIELNKDEY